MQAQRYSSASGGENTESESSNSEVRPKYWGALVFAGAFAASVAFWVVFSVKTWTLNPVAVILTGVGLGGTGGGLIHAVRGHWILARERPHTWIILWRLSCGVAYGGVALITVGLLWFLVQFVILLAK